MITVKEYGSGYGPRTRANAKAAQVTIAIAVDYTTAGEILTEKVAGDRYLRVPYEELRKRRTTEALVEQLCSRAIKQQGFLRGATDRPLIESLNVAGNGIYTFHKHGITQTQVNKVVLRFLRMVCDRILVANVRSGGQTGIDQAGIWAATKLGIPALALMPEGYMVRTVKGRDRKQTVAEAVARLLA